MSRDASRRLRWPSGICVDVQGTKLGEAHGKAVHNRRAYRAEYRGGMGGAIGSYDKALLFVAAERVPLRCIRKESRERLDNLVHGNVTSEKVDFARSGGAIAAPLDIGGCKRFRHRVPCCGVSRHGVLPFADVVAAVYLGIKLAGIGVNLVKILQKFGTAGQAWYFAAGRASESASG